MRKKYAYFVDNIEMPKKNFLKELKKCCERTVQTDVIAGWCEVDAVGFDEKMFKTALRSINGGIRVSLPSRYDSKAYKLFYRKEIKNCRKSDKGYIRELYRQKFWYFIMINFNKLYKWCDKHLKCDTLPF